MGGRQLTDRASVQRLRTARHHTSATQLFRAIGRDPDLGIDRLAEDYAMDREQLLDILADIAYHEARASRLAWLAAHAVGVVFVLGLVSLSLLGSARLG